MPILRFVVATMLLTACFADDPLVDDLASEDPDSDARSDAMGEFGYYAVARASTDCAGVECTEFTVYQPNLTLTRCGQGQAKRECKVAIDWSKTEFDDGEIETIVAAMDAATTERTRRKVLLRGDIAAGTLVVTEVWGALNDNPVLGSKSEVAVKLRFAPQMDEFFDSCMKESNGVFCSMKQLKLNSQRTSTLTRIQSTANLDSQLVLSIAQLLRQDVEVIISGALTDGGSREIKAAYVRFLPGMI